MTPVFALMLVAFPSQALTTQSGPYELQVRVDGMPARTFLHDGETFVLGHLGERYTLRVLNRTARRVEAVVSVDGRDVIDGMPADWRTKRGYLVPAGGSVDIDGWRISREEAAAFRFSRVRDSYAAKIGSAREVGVIGVAIFPERWYPRPLQPTYPAPRASPNSGMRDEQDGRPDVGSGPKAESKAPAGAPPPLAQRAEERPGLGTEYGESVWSQVREVPFERAFQRPEVVMGTRYDDRAGLIALGIDVDGGTVSEVDLRRTAEPFPVVDRSYAPPPPGWRR